MIHFNKPPYTSLEKKFVNEAMQNVTISGDGPFTNKCEKWFEKELQCEKALLTPSCTHALEMMAILIDIKEGDEVIMPSYTFVSTANAFAIRGAKIVFVDIKADTLNIDEDKIEDAISDKTKAIVVVHYAGVSCNMDKIMTLSDKYDIFVLEDAAQGVKSYYKEKPLGTIGHFGAFSFHETKNITSAGEGGLLIINDKRFTQRAEIIREKGTNRKLFFRGLVDKYSWVDLGSSYLLNDVSAAYLWAQIQMIDNIQVDRLNTWNRYEKGLKQLSSKGFITLPTVPSDCTNNAHMFYIKVRDLEERESLIKYLKQNDINAVFHYVPLHTAPAGKIFGKFEGIDEFTTTESERLVRLPLYYGLDKEKVEYIIQKIKSFYE